MAETSRGSARLEDFETARSGGAAERDRKGRMVAGIKEGGGREVRRSSGHANEPAIQVICLVSD